MPMRAPRCFGSAAIVSMVSGDTGRTPNEGMTAGSQSIENSGTALRMAAAEVRAILIELASARLEMSAALASRSQPSRRTPETVGARFRRCSHGRFAGR